MEKNVFIFTGESYMIKKSLKTLKQNSKICFHEMNITEFRNSPKGDEIKEACTAVPFMSEMRLVIVHECAALGSKESSDDAKKIIEAIESMPDTTVLALCSQDMPDKRRLLYKKVKETGQIKEFLKPRRFESIDFVISKVKEEGASISKSNAEMLVDTAGCDYYSLENELKKLAAYCGYKEIKGAHIKECVSRSLEFNVFEIHSLLAAANAREASMLLEDIMREERPEAIIGLVARKIRDMYKIKTLLDRGDSVTKAASLTGIKDFAAEMLARESKRFSQQDLRDSLKILADTDYKIKSGEGDAYMTLQKALFDVYKI